MDTSRARESHAGDGVLRRTAEALGVRHEPERLARLVEEAQGAGVMADA